MTLPDPATGKDMTPTQEQLKVVLWRYGWGPRQGQPIAFHRSGNGWQLGSGTVVNPWKGRTAPSEPMDALRDIYAANDLVLAAPEPK